MIITKIAGGLGNQMFQYAIAKSIAIKNSDEFKLDISFYSKQTLRKYELDLFTIEENLDSGESLLSKVKRKLGFILGDYYREKETTIFDKKVFDYDENIILDGYWQNENYFKEIRDDIIKDFTPKIDISNEAKKHLKQICSSNSISIHLRRGDYIHNSHINNVHGTCDLDYYMKAIKYINKNTENIKYFIFSDDIVWCKENFDFLENKVFIDDTKSGIDDLELMKHCKHNIIANSSFSWWGAWLNENDNKIVVAPKTWWASRQDKHIAPLNWKKI